MIKQIQLRGISRTPSDRLSEDGGLSESLNMYLDTAESAPAFVPEDVTEELGLPADLEAERIFIHKTANYENYIVVQSDRVVAFTPGIKDEEPLLIFELVGGEKVNDITSVGHTLIISTTKRMFYTLFRNSKYLFLGTKVPFPHINFVAKNGSNYYPISNGLSPGEQGDWRFDSLPSEKDWNEDYNSDKDVHGDQTKANLLKAIWAAIDEGVAGAIKKGYLIGGVIMRYAIELYDGTLISSIPILLDNGYKDAFETKITVRSLRTTSSGGVGGTGNVTTTTNKYTAFAIKAPYYGIYAKLNSSFPWEDWQDIISSINIYMSKVPLSPRNRNMSYMTSRTVSEIEGESYNYEFLGTLRLGDKNDTEFIYNLLEASSLTHLVNQSFFNNSSKIIGDEWEGLKISFSELKSGINIDLSRLSGVVLETKKILNEDDMSHYSISSNRSFAYNNRLLLCSPLNIIEYDYNKLNSYKDGDIGQKIQYEVTFVIETSDGRKTVNKNFSYDDGQIYAFQIFPDNRATKMLVKATDVDSGEVRYGEFDMTPHPHLNCAYSYGGIENKLVDLCSLDSISIYIGDSCEQMYNKLYVSKSENPFAFPLNNKYTFGSNIIGVAIATTALSQGQFGMFPIYVFTEDGIWAMETAADGSFVSPKPLSREVCINPDSICSIDNAVVFVTSKAVMMIQGSQVMNISQYMNGRHYTPNASAVDLINAQEGFSEFESAITNDDPFMKFMRKAKVAYDYTGQRLIFISKKEDGTAYGYQYVYKIDTQTWHKVAFSGFDLETPLNSYPECLVQTQPEEREIQKSVVWFELASGKIAASVISAFNKQTNIGLKKAKYFLNAVEPLDEDAVDNLNTILDELAQEYNFTYNLREETQSVIVGYTKIYSLSTVLDASTTQDTAKGILITRPFDLGMPDVYKSITSIKIRGDFDKGNVKYILQGSDDGRTFYTLSSLRGKSWKMFRIFILADLEPTERISWIDIDFEPRYQNKLR